MAAEESNVPAITLTDPSNESARPESQQSPIRNGESLDLGSQVAGTVRTASVRSGSWASSNGRPDSSHSGWGSPSRLVRRLSNNAPNASPASSTQDVNGGGRYHEAQTAIDPLSQHILERTNAPLSVPSTTRPTTAESNALKDERSSKEPNPAPAVQEALAPVRSDTAEHAHKELKKGVKAVSFLSKLMGGAAKKKAIDEEAMDEDSSSNADRLEGTEATVFAQPADNMGFSFSPRHPQPPAYIKVRSKYKKQRDFDRLFLAQELVCGKRRRPAGQNGVSKLRRKSSAATEANTVWAMEFSRDGKHLAAAGADMIVRLWAVLSSSEDRQNHEKQESSESEANGAEIRAEHLSAPVFQSRPVREYEGHTATVLDLSWSKNNFLLSSSMDKTVRLWHPTRPECLCTFKHNDFVPSISFHPKDDRFFLAGSLDSKLRLWNIPDKSVAYMAPVRDMITAVAFTPDGKYAVAGTLTGQCAFYETEGLKFQTQIQVRSTRGQNAKGSKITGIQAHYAPSGDVKLLITSNDSRIRLYNFRDKSLELKLKGIENNSSQIRATLSDCGRYVVCGSEDKKAYIWSLHPLEADKRDKRPLEMFQAHSTVTTAVCFAPAKTRHLLSKSEDPVYDLCNPPPVTLMSRAERAESQSSSKPPTEAGSTKAMPTDIDGRSEKPQPSPAYMVRQSHKDGNIIVTADYMGKIKVFRQDCAWAKRKTDEWDRSSLFTKRGGRSSVTGSLATKGSQRSLRERASGSTQAPSDRILSWRQGIASTPSIANGTRRSSSKHTSRSVSPSKSPDLRSKPEKPGTLKSAHPLAEDTSADAANSDPARVSPTSSSRLPCDRDDNPLLIHDGGQSDAFWNTEQYRERAERIHRIRDDPLTPIVSNEGGDNSGGHGNAYGGRMGSQDANHLGVRPPLNRDPSSVSRLSDERSSGSQEYDDARENGDDDVTRCPQCGGTTFAARRATDGMMRLVCTACGHTHA